jgi:hypothetical protein
MSPLKHAQSSEIQIRQVFRYMQQRGSINRYDAEKIGICHLAARVQDLEEIGLEYKFCDENTVTDFHGIVHDGIRRYFIDWARMTPKAKATFARWGK